MKDNQALNPDAIYAAMAWLRSYVESPEGQEHYRVFLEQKEADPNPLADQLRVVLKETGADYYERPVLEISDEMKEEIYPDETISVDVGIEFARGMIWGSPNFTTAFLRGAQPESDPIKIAMRRFVADRAN